MTQNIPIIMKILAILLLLGFGLSTLVIYEKMENVYFSMLETKDNQTEILTISATIETSPVPVPTVNPQLLIYQEFLEQDKTDEGFYLDDTKLNLTYTCGHFTRQLIKNATEQDIFLGSAILGTEKYFRGSNNHIVCYFTIDREYYFVESQTDDIFSSETAYNYGYKYVKLYEKGNQVPTYWKGIKYPDINLEELYGE